MTSDEIHTFLPTSFPGSFLEVEKGLWERGYIFTILWIPKNFVEVFLCFVPGMFKFL